jgi:hypothetical protein
MDFIFPPAIASVLAVLLVAVSVWATALCVRRLRTAYRLAGEYACAVWLVRGIRCLIIALTAAAWAAGCYWRQHWLLIVGLVILAQELYEGFVLSAALREGLRHENGRRSPGVV